MLKLLLLTLLAVASADDCWVGDWTPWSECQPSLKCNAVTDYNPVTLVAAAEEWDEGRVWMEYMVTKKMEAYKKQEACLADGTCPELAPKPAKGFTPCVDGYAGEYPCSNIDMLSFTPFSDMDFGAGEATRGNDVWGWYDAEYQKEYAIMGFNGGTAFVDVTNAINPQPVAWLSTSTVPSNWRDIKVIDHHAYIVSEAADHGMQVFDLHSLRGLTSLTRVSASYLYSRYGQCHNIVSNTETKYLYSVGSTRNTSPGYNICSGGLHVTDVSNPDDPQYAGCFGTDGYVHDAECVIYRGPDERYVGNEVCFCYNENSLTLVDVTDKNNMYMISKRGYQGSQYTHQGWLTEDMSALLLDDELDEERSNTDKRTRTFFWDVRDLEDPVLRSTFYSTETSIDHNQYILNGLSYQSNYQAGLRILDIDMENFALNEVAYFDVYPSATESTFGAGTWSNYPYLPSGNIIVSSINYGLYVLRLDQTAVDQMRSGHSGYQQRYMEVLGADGVCSPVRETRACSASC